MPGIAILLLLALLAACSTGEQEFIEAVTEDRAAGAKWHFVGPSDLDPTAKALPLQCVDSDTDEICGKPFILFKLKFPK